MPGDDPSVHRNEFDPASHVIGFENLSDKLQIADSLTNGYAELMGVDQTRELTFGFKPLVSNGQQVLIPTEERPAQFRGTR